MYLNTRSLLIFLSLFLSASSALNSKSEILDSILTNFKHDTKKLFKVWHFLFNKEYEVNSLQGLNKYKTFKKNLKEVEAHNSNKGIYTFELGLNQFSDMTFEEFAENYNLKPIREEELERGIRKLNSFNLDDYNDEDDIAAAPAQTPVKRGNYDYRDMMLPVRDQGLVCGSCWAFATLAIIEGAHIINGSNVKDYFSTQHSIDCDKSNNGCKGGTFDNSLRFFTRGFRTIWESDYPYRAETGNCQEKGKKRTDFGIAKIRSINGGATIDVLLENGPFGVSVIADFFMKNYNQGIFNCKGVGNPNHAVVVVGYNAGINGESYYIIRNSWGETWGEKGHIRISTKNGACGVEKHGFQPII